MRAGVEPGVAAAHELNAQLALVEVGAVHVGDLELAAPMKKNAYGQYLLGVLKDRVF